jgi:outer membrane protein W
MKKILCCLLVTVAISTFTRAQTEKGDWMVGGSFLINTTKRVSQFQFNPTVGYFFFKNFVGGAEMMIDFLKEAEKRTTSLGAGPFARYYFELKEPQFKPFVHINLGLNSTRTKIEGEETTRVTYTRFVLGGGGAYFINDNVAIDGMAGYSYAKVENTPGSGGFIFRVGFQVHLLGSEVRVGK